MNYKEVLKCLKMPSYVSNDFYSMLFARSIGGTAGYDELTGTPPLTFTANGRNLINYRIYGSSDGVGEQAENLFDVSKVESGTDAYGGSIAVNNNVIVVTTSERSSNVISPGNKTLQDLTENLVVGETYTIFANTTGSTNIFLYRANVVIPFRVAFTLTSEMLTSIVCWYATGRNSTATITNFMLVKSSTAPAQYIPFGYQINAEVGDSATTTDIPIYIGNTPLAQGEYVDYSKQKVYKYVGGVLTPTDPPVALPALPTIDGATIVDFDNTPKPSEVYIKYPK